jgi:hypothetical protein
MTILLGNYKRATTSQQLRPRKALLFRTWFRHQTFSIIRFYEPRIFGRYLEVPKSISGYSGVEFNRNNAFTFDFTLSYAKFDQGRSNYGIAVAPKYRVNKFSIYLIIDYTNKTNDLGWVGFESSDIIIGKRNRNTAKRPDR